MTALKQSKSQLFWFSPLALLYSVADSGGHPRFLRFDIQNPPRGWRPLLEILDPPLLLAKETKVKRRAQLLN